MLSSSDVTLPAADLLQALVTCLSHKDPQIRCLTESRCCAGANELFGDATVGPSCDGVVLAGLTLSCGLLYFVGMQHGMA